MGHSLGLYRFSDGELADFDMDLVRAVLSPVAAVPEGVIDGATEYWIRATDGSEAEVSVSGGEINVIRPQVGDVWKIIIELADRLRAAVLLPDGRLLCREEMRGHLPRAWSTMPFSSRRSPSPPSRGRRARSRTR
ncbi:hypothetical protein ACFUAC_00865 [Streptomyces sp. NPDC057148]|uniref:hypothetical protein n=1 Tax=unclassified Streptomyces TaxID=2593676 RepID=UPI003636146F